MRLLALFALNADGARGRGVVLPRARRPLGVCRRKGRRRSYGAAVSRRACAEETFFSFFGFDGPPAPPSGLADKTSAGIAHRLSVKSLAPVMMKTRPPLRHDASP